MTDFWEAERRAVYRPIYERRDVRSQFLKDPVPDDALTRILSAAHHALSVGFMQSWDFIVIRDAAVRAKVHRNFECASKRAAEVYQGEPRKMYDGLKLAGILDAPLNISVTCDPERAKGSGLGRQTDPSVALYSTEQLRLTLGIPHGLTVVAYLCVGYVSEFRPQPDLEERGWETRGSLAGVVHFERWGVRSI